MYSFLQSEEFVKLESEYPLLRRARQQFTGLRGIACAVVDIETTGLEPRQNEITEVAALKIEKGQIVDVFNVLINIKRPLPQEIIRLTGITDEMLMAGEEKTAALQSFLDFVGEAPLVAHNVDFDLPFLNHHLKEGLAKSLNNPPICTLKLSQKLLPGLASHKLGRVAEYFKIPTPLTHRAPGDVEITYQVWLKLIDLLEKHEIATLEALLKFAG